MSAWVLRLYPVWRELRSGILLFPQVEEIHWTGLESGCNQRLGLNGSDDPSTPLRDPLRSLTSTVPLQTFLPFNWEFTFKSSGGDPLSLNSWPLLHIYWECFCLCHLKARGCLNTQFRKRLKIDGLSALHFFPVAMCPGYYLPEREEECKLACWKYYSLTMLLDGTRTWELRAWCKTFTFQSNFLSHSKFSLSWEFMNRCSFLVFLSLQELYALSVPHLPLVSLPGSKILTSSSQGQG